jgi:hypothetical protein
MPRFEADDQETGSIASPPAQVVQEPERQKWYRWRRDSDRKPKEEKAVDIDYVEEVDGVWGKAGEGAVNYQTVGW